MLYTVVHNMPSEPRGLELPHVRFPTSLGELRRKRRVSQETVAAEVRVKRHYVGWWETGIALPTNEMYERLKLVFPQDEIYPDWVVAVIRMLSEAREKVPV